ncbi:hypothetical protein [Hufsiella ginkgonis]|uniref:Uncharacterized protein n=1 Tax=Hufsiella ginkgonis TaxID=2695274 RepID=A0A7K1XXF8_9SPHI|nr:hypothetical protein [Hufsiella ginkgonis]MXV15680.1 hypothetical protein [Hufsiella ginkgonis]
MKNSLILFRLLLTAIFPVKGIARPAKPGTWVTTTLGAKGVRNCTFSGTLPRQSFARLVNSTHFFFTGNYASNTMKSFLDTENFAEIAETGNNIAPR